MIGTGPYYISDYQRSIAIHAQAPPRLLRQERVLRGRDPTTRSSRNTRRWRRSSAPATSTSRAAAATVAPGRDPPDDARKCRRSTSIAWSNLSRRRATALIFGWKTPPLRDERVRQALSMSHDRDLWIDVVEQRQKFEADGLPVERRWYGPFPSVPESYDGWRLEPRDEKDVRRQREVLQARHRRGQEAACGGRLPGRPRAHLNLPCGHRLRRRLRTARWRCARASTARSASSSTTT